MPKSKNKHTSRKPPMIKPTDKKIIKQVIKDELTKARHESAEEAIELSSALIQVFTCIVLNDKFQFTTEQIEKFINHVSCLTANITDNYTSNFEAIEFYKNELNLEVPPILIKYLEDGAIKEGV